MPASHAELAALAAHLAQRREPVLRAWRKAVKSDALMCSAAALPRQQLHDHIPALLADYEQSLSADSDGAHGAAAVAPQRDAAAHGLTRWQQGFDLVEVARELGFLNECMVAELELCAQTEARFTPQVMAAARVRWARLYCLTVSSSTAQYDKLRQVEAADQINDLEQALLALREVEQERAGLWQQAEHDLRGNLGVVANATAGLNSGHASAAARESFLALLDRNVAALHHVLDNVASLARLQGGTQQRKLSSVDAAELLRGVCAALQPQAAQRALALTAAGPAPLVVEADAVMTGDIVRNLLADALRRTADGAVNVAWGTDPARDGRRWFIAITDTGTARDALDDSAVVGALQLMTIAHAGRPGAGTALPTSAPATQRISIAVVKRLCDVLEAALDVQPTASGTVYRVVLPMRYSS